MGVGFLILIKWINLHLLYFFKQMFCGDGFVVVMC